MWRGLYLSFNIIVCWSILKLTTIILANRHIWCGMNLWENVTDMLDEDDGPDLRSPLSEEKSEGEENMSDKSDPDLSDEQVLEAPRLYALSQ